MNPNREELLLGLALTKPAAERAARLDRRILLLGPSGRERMGLKNNVCNRITAAVSRQIQLRLR